MNYDFAIWWKVRIAYLYYQYEAAIKLLEMSENIYAFLIVIIIGKTSIPATGISTECWLQNLKRFQYGEWSPFLTAHVYDWFPQVWTAIHRLEIHK